MVNKTYKVVTQRDQYFKSRFNPEMLGLLLNLYAEDGWRVVSMTATDVGSFWGSFWQKGGGATRQELVVLLERDIVADEAPHTVKSDTRSAAPTLTKAVLPFIEPKQGCNINGARAVAHSIGLTSLSGPLSPLCPKCTKPIDAGVERCPHCWTFLPNLVA